MKITKKSIISGKVTTLDLNITEQQMLEWQSGKMVQDAFPQLNVDEREFLITGMTKEEMNKVFGDNE